MARETRPSAEPPNRPKAGLDLKVDGDVGVVSVAGLVDETFRGFGVLDKNLKSLVIEVSQMTRMTSFGVRQWLKAMDALPKTIADLYLLNCPTFFVDQLNMVLNFGGAGKVLSVMAPYTCPSCGVESGESIDVLAERTTLAMGGVPEKDCVRCGAKLEFDETPESYFSFVTKYGASSIQPTTAQALALSGLYVAADFAAEKPPRIIKLVHGPVTYFRIIGTVGSMFRARPLLVGAEGEVVIDLAEVDRFDPLGSREWRRLLKNLVGQVPSVTLVDITEAFLRSAGDSVTASRSISVSSVLVPFKCVDCGKVQMESQSLSGQQGPLTFPDGVCSTCGGATQSTLRVEALATLERANTVVPPTSAKLIEQRQEILSRALTESNVASAGESASPALSPDDTILGKYKIIRKLSTGGMAEVFLAKQVGIGGFEKPVALKRILRQLLESRHFAVDMFLNEAKIAGRLIHPNIVQVLDVGEVGGALYLAMEYVHGRDLREALKKLHAARNVVPLGTACYIISQVAQALHHAYWSTDLNGKQLAVIHRDVSPHNVILGFDGSVKLLDFGVAMSAVTEQSRDALIAGKWAYMSPEHTANQQAIDHRSDLFSVGVMLYLLTAGQMPFAGNDPREIVKKIRAGTYKPLKLAAPDVPSAVSELVTRLLSPNPDERPRTGLEVVTSLTDFTRSYGLESSAATVVSLLQHLFQDVDADAQTQRRTIDSVDAPGAMKVAIGSGLMPVQSAPAAGASESNEGAAIDQSVSLPRASSRDLPVARTSSRDLSVPRTSSREIFARARSTDGKRSDVPSLRPSRMLTLGWVFLVVLVLGAVVLGLYMMFGSL